MRSVQQVGTGTTVLTGDSTYLGGTTHYFGHSPAWERRRDGQHHRDVVDNGILAFNRSDVSALTGIISGTGSVQQTGTGTTVLTADNTYTGGTTITAGTLQVGNGETSGSIVGDVTDNGALAFNRSDVVTFAGVISGAGSVQQNGPGTTILTGDSTYAGGTTINAGTVQLGNGGTTGSVAGDITNNGVLAFDRSNVLTVVGTITGAGSVQQNGTGTTVLTGDNNYAGGTTITAGTLQLGNGGTTGSITGAVTQQRKLAFNRSDVLTVAGAISGTGSVQQNGPGTTVLTADNSYSGGTAINAGTLQLGDGGTTGSLAGDVLDNGILAFNRSDAVTFAGAISGSGGVAMLSNSTLTLTGANSYTGATTVSAGTLLAGSATGLSPTSALIVNRPRT